MRSNRTDNTYKQPNIKNMFEIVYHEETLGYTVIVPIVGDSVFGYTIWRVDYKERIAYVTK